MVAGGREGAEASGKETTGGKGGEREGPGCQDISGGFNTTVVPIKLTIYTHVYVLPILLSIQILPRATETPPTHASDRLCSDCVVLTLSLLLASVHSDMCT